MAEKACARSLRGVNDRTPLETSKPNGSPPCHLFPSSPREPFPPVGCVQLVFPRVGPRRLLTSRASNQHKIKHDTSLAGRACYYGGDPTAASLHFHAATQLDDAGLPAWEGVALTQVASGDYLGAAKTYEELVRVFLWVLWEGKENKERRARASERGGH